MPSSLDLSYMNRELVALTDADIKRYCPAAFAQGARSDVSDRYGFVSTVELLKAMRDSGYVPTQVNSYFRRSEENKGFTKHMIRFRTAGERPKRVGDVVPQIILVNSHDRSSQFALYMGLWRLICANGLMVSDGAHVQPLIVRHTVAAIEGLLEAVTKLVHMQKHVFDFVELMRQVQLTEKQAVQFAHDALALRPERAGAIDATQLLKARRTEDDGLDVWHVYNRSQENLMRGGLTGVTANNRAIVTRGVTSVNADMHINVGLWRLAVEAVEKARTGSAKTVKVASDAVAKASAKAAQDVAEAGIAEPKAKGKATAKKIKAEKVDKVGKQPPSKKMTQAERDTRSDADHKAITGEPAKARKARGAPEATPGTPAAGEAPSEAAKGPAEAPAEATTTAEAPKTTA